MSFLILTRSEKAKIFVCVKSHSPKGYEHFFERVVLAERLREVHALLGFTRIESPRDWGEVEDIPARNAGAFLVPIAHGCQPSKCEVREFFCN